MHRHPTANARAYRTDFALIRPDPNGGWVEEAFNAEIAQRIHDSAFKALDIRTDGQVMVDQADDWIGHQLAGAVEGNVAAAVGLNEFYAEFGKLRLISQQMTGYIGTAAQCYDRRMLDEQNPLWCAGYHIGVNLLLNLPGLFVRNQSQCLSFDQNIPR